MNKTKLSNQWFVLIAAIVFSICSLIAAQDVRAAEPKLQEETNADPNSTLGLAAPADAFVLFDGTNFDAWKPFSFLAINQKEIQGFANQRESQRREHGVSGVCDRGCWCAESK